MLYITVTLLIILALWLGPKVLEFFENQERANMPPPNPNDRIS